MLFPFIIVLDLLNIEKFVIPSNSIILSLLINGLIGTVLSDLLWSYSIFFTSPTVATVGLSLTIPLAIFTDRLLHHSNFTIIYVGGAVLVLSSFLIVNLTSKEKEKKFFTTIKNKILLLLYIKMFSMTLTSLVNFLQE